MQKMMDTSLENEKKKTLRQTLLPLCEGFLFKVNDPVDVFLRRPFGWIEGKIVEVRAETFCHRVRLESVYEGQEEMDIFFWADVSHDEMALMPHRTHCLEDWRSNIEKHTHFECMEKGRWEQCKKVYQRDGQVLVATETDRHCFPITSPHLRCLWEFRDPL